MSNLFYNEWSSSIFSKGAGGDFETPANQQYMEDTRKGHPLFEVEYASRCPYPSWERWDCFYNSTYHEALDVKFSAPTISFPAMIPTVDGTLSVQQVERTSPVLLPDAELYDYRAQKLYAVFSQFNIATTDQLVAWTGMNRDDVEKGLNILYSSGVILSGGDSWVHKPSSGDIWMMKIASPEARRYYEGLDPLSRVLTLGVDVNDIETPVGSNSPSAVRHNMFISEMCLRIMENSDNIVTAWGDYFGAESRFHDPLDSVARRHNHGDAILVTNNGSLVILELSTSHASSRAGLEMFLNKAAAWMGVIANSDLDISVIFVDTRWRTNRNVLYRGVFSGIMDASKPYANNELSRQQALGHIGIANAAWWFPRPGATSKAASRLMAFSPSEYRFKAFDQPDPEFSSSSVRRNVVINSALALHRPPWVGEEPSLREYDMGVSKSHEDSIRRMM